MAKYLLLISLGLLVSGCTAVIPDMPQPKLNQYRPSEIPQSSEKTHDIEKKSSANSWQ